MRTGDSAAAGPSHKTLRSEYRVTRVNSYRALGFLFGAGWAFSFNFVGAIYGSEAIALLCLPFLMPLKQLSRSRTMAFVVVALGVVALGLLNADIVNETASTVAMKGIANPVFAVTNALFVYCLVKKDRAAVLFMLAGGFLFTLAFGSGAYRTASGVEIDLMSALNVESVNLFKIRIAPFLVPLILLSTAVVFRGGAYVSSLFLILSSLVFFYFDARGIAVTLLLSGVALFLTQANSRFKFRDYLFAIVGAAIISQIAYVRYVDYTLVNNPDGHNGIQLRSLDNPHNPLELMARGRSSWIIAPIAISERPLSGYGSWAEDEGGRFSYLNAQATDKVELFDAVASSRDFLIPAHSVLLAAWVWGGVISAIGAAWLLVLLVKTAFRYSRVERMYAPIFFFFSISLVWDMLFSPFQAIRLSLFWLPALIALTEEVPARFRDLRRQ